MELVGNTWLRTRFNLEQISLAHESHLGTRLSTIHERDGRTVRTFPRQYEPTLPGDPLAQIEFGLKYDGVALELLHHVFTRLSPIEVAHHVAESPTGRYARQIGFLYEFLIGNRVPLPASVRIGGNYVPILDADRYITAEAVKVPRWRINDNLLGSRDFSPVVRRTVAVQEGSRRDWRAAIDAVLAGTPAALLYRALSYLYAKETRSSFLIERDEPGHGREERFIAALREAGKVPAVESVGAARLIALQNLIVDPRYAETGFRTIQNYVGQTMPGLRERVHYVCPPPGLVPTLMAGLAACMARLEAMTVAPSIQAAVTAFQFVFVHPFEDGNGRLHRFLLHDVLARRGVVQHGATLPLSATILDDMPGYDQALEAFANSIMRRATYKLSIGGQLTLENPAELEPAWRYPDLTPQVEYLHSVMARTIAELPEELNFLRRHDLARAEVRRVVDLPDRRLTSLLRWLDDGGGRLSKNKRKQFAELSDDEVQRVQAAYADAQE